MLAPWISVHGVSHSAPAPCVESLQGRLNSSCALLSSSEPRLVRSASPAGHAPKKYNLHLDALRAKVNVHTRESAFLVALEDGTGPAPIMPSAGWSEAPPLPK